MGESLSGRVAASGEPLAVGDFANDPRTAAAHRDIMRDMGYRAWLGVPIKMGERSIGVLGIVIELWNPGLIFPGTVGAISLILGLYGLQVLPVSLAGLLLMLLMFSGQLRSRGKMFLSKHFFKNKYDYREEWLRVTRTLFTCASSVAAEPVARFEPLKSVGTVIAVPAAL